MSIIRFEHILLYLKNTKVSDTVLTTYEVFTIIHLPNPFPREVYVLKIIKLLVFVSLFDYCHALRTH